MKTIYFVTFWVVIALGIIFSFLFGRGVIDAITWFVFELCTMISLAILGCASEYSEYDGYIGTEEYFKEYEEYKKWVETRDAYLNGELEE